MKRETRTIEYLVAMNGEGKFFTLQFDCETTTPGITDNLIDAYAVHPPKDIVCESGRTIKLDDGIIHPAPYYFENSDRMRRWLEGFRMVRVTETIEAWVQETI